MTDEQAERLYELMNNMWRECDKIEGTSLAEDGKGPGLFMSNLELRYFASEIEKFINEEFGQKEQIL